MLDLSPTKLVIIFVVVIVLLGPKRLPQVARQLGAGWRKLVGFQQQIERELRESMPDLPSSQEIARFARSPVSILNHLAEFPASPDDTLVEDPGAPDPGPPPLEAPGPGGGPDAAPRPDAAASGPLPPATTVESPPRGVSSDGPWPEDRSSAGRPAAAGARRAGRPARPVRQAETLADLAALAADDPTMN